MTVLKQSLEHHRQKSEGSHKYFMDVTKKCSEEWAEIVELEGRLPELTGDEKEASDNETQVQPSTVS